MAYRQINTPYYRVHLQNTNGDDGYAFIEFEGDFTPSTTDMEASVNALASSLDNVSGITFIDAVLVTETETAI